MVDGIVTAFVVLAIFAVVALLLGLYVWRVDPHQVAVWRAALRAKREGRDAPSIITARSASFRAVSGSAFTSGCIASGKRA